MNFHFTKFLKINEIKIIFDKSKQIFNECDVLSINLVTYLCFNSRIVKIWNERNLLLCYGITSKNIYIISDLQGQSLKHFKYLLTLIKLGCVSKRNHQMEKLKEKNQFYQYHFPRCKNYLGGGSRHGKANLLSDDVILCKTTKQS